MEKYVNQANEHVKRMQELITAINVANKAYYGPGEELMSNHAYDRLVVELETLEEITGLHLDNSPIGKVGYEVVSELAKRKHLHPAKSLDKTKSVEDLSVFMGTHQCVLSWKLDGLTLVLNYENGKLVSGVTRGDGFVGEDVTHNVKYICGIPMTIDYKEPLEVRGEVVISYSDFEKINNFIENEDERYANPRNLASSSLRLLDSKKARRRYMRFAAFEWVSAQDVCSLYSESLHQLESFGFDVVQYVIVQDLNALKEAIAMFESHLMDGTMKIPSDGLVLAYEDLNYAASLGSTDHHPRGMMAFKWRDDEVETVLRGVEWSASRTGLLNPVAIFDTVQLEGTSVSRASLHNVNMFLNLQLGVGDKLMVYKANKIIPQVADNLTRSGTCDVPECCPICGGVTECRRLGDTMNTSSGSVFLYCTNPNCSAKHAGKFERMVSRDGLNVRGMGSEVVQQLVSHGWLCRYADLFYLSEYRDEMLCLEGFGEKSVDNLLCSIHDAEKTTFRKAFYALGIPNCGRDVGEILDRFFGSRLFGTSEDVSKTKQFVALMSSDSCMSQLQALDGIGAVTANYLVSFWKEHHQECIEFLAELEITDDYVSWNLQESHKSQKLAGLTFVITGKLRRYPSRDALKSEIQALGGKVSGSVSKNTSYLINNDLESESGKNKNAKALGIPIISEDDFVVMTKYS